MGKQLGRLKWTLRTRQTGHPVPQHWPWPTSSTAGLPTGSACGMAEGREMQDPGLQRTAHWGATGRSQGGGNMHAQFLLPNSPIKFSHENIPLKKCVQGSRERPGGFHCQRSLLHERTSLRVGRKWSLPHHSLVGTHVLVHGHRQVTKKKKITYSTPKFASSLKQKFTQYSRWLTWSELSTTLTVTMSITLPDIELGADLYPLAVLLSKTSQSRYYFSHAISRRAQIIHIKSHNFLVYSIARTWA